MCREKEYKYLVVTGDAALRNSEDDELEHLDHFRFRFNAVWNGTDIFSVLGEISVRVQCARWPWVVNFELRDVWQGHADE
jgi:hypothetical protein